MENEKPEETLPNSNPNNSNEEPNLGETIAFSPNRGGAQSFPTQPVPANDKVVDPGATMPILASPDSTPAAASPVQEPFDSSEKDFSNPSGFGETMAVPVSRDPAPVPTSTSAQAINPPEPPKPPLKKKSNRWRGFLITLAGLLVLLLVAGFSAYQGYNSGIDIRTGAQETQTAQQIAQQYQLGLQDLTDKQYYRARQRFEYVIQLDPGYPGVTEKLAEVLLELNTTATPTPVPTPTLTPTPDLRGVEDKFSQGQQALANKDWTAAIDSLLALRKEDPSYRAIEIDGMLYLALRNRGMDKIGKMADLEGGMYDLAQAEAFGPLDAEAQGYQASASTYVTGASFWEINWEQAVEYFSQIAPQMPYLRDGSGWTAQDRYRIALTGYGDQLAGQEAWCDAQAQYELAMTLNPPDDEASSLEAAYNDAFNNCTGGDSEEGEESEGNSDENTPEP